MPTPAIAYATLIAFAQPAGPTSGEPIVTSPIPEHLAATTVSAGLDSAASDGASTSDADKSGPVMQDIVVVAPPRPTPEDPLARTNVKVFKFVRSIDGSITEPAAMAFQRTVPGPLRDGFHNIFDNLDEPLIAANFLLQLHPGKAVETLVRFVINSTIGWAGLFDVAGKPYINLPRRPNGFGDTLGYYGVKPGAYLFLPFIGPSDPRDLFGGAVDLASSPLRWVGGPFKSIWYQVPTQAFSALDTRARFQKHLEDFRSGDRGIYISEREYWFRLRAARIAAHKAGDHGPPVLDVSTTSPASPAATPAAVSPAPAPAPAP